MKKIMLFMLGLCVTSLTMSSQWQRLSPYTQQFLQSSKQAFGQTSALRTAAPTFRTGIRQFSNQPKNLGYWNTFKNWGNNMRNQFSYYIPQSMRNFSTQHHTLLGRTAAVTGTLVAGVSMGSILGTGISLTRALKELHLQADTMLQQATELRQQATETNLETSEQPQSTERSDGLLQKLDTMTQQVEESKEKMQEINAKMKDINGMLDKTNRMIKEATDRMKEAAK